MMKYAKLAALVLTLSFAFGLSAGCPNNPPNLPSVPVLVVKTDADFRAALAYTYDVLDAATDTIIAARRLEEALAIPAEAHKKVHDATGDVLADIKVLVSKIDSKALTKWEDVRAQIQPIIDKIQSVLTIAATKGTSFWAKLSAALNIILPIIAGIR